MAPTFQAEGSQDSGTGNLTIVWPGHAAGDIGLLVIESTIGEAANLSSANGFAAVVGSPVLSSPGGTGTGGTRLTLYWCRATSSSMASPVITDPGNHVAAVIITFRGCVATGDPFDTAYTTGYKSSASTTVTLPSVTTTGEDELVLWCAARENDLAGGGFTSPTSSAGHSLTECVNRGTAQGNGGGYVVYSAPLASAGASGTVTATVPLTFNAQLTVALKPDTSTPPPPARTSDFFLAL